MNDVEEMCDRLAFMVDGRIAEINTSKNLKLAHGQRKLKVEYSANDSTHESEFELKNLGDNSDFLDIINNKKIITMHTQEMTLDNIFIEVTGVNDHV